VRQLLDQAAKSQGDPSAYWVLCREALDIAVQGGDSDRTVEAIETAARLFDIDPLLMKTASLSSVAKSVKAPEESGALTEALLKHVDDLIRADQFDTSDKLVALAVQQSKKSNDAGLATRAATRAKEVSEAKTLFAAMKGVLEALAKNPEDTGSNLEMGKFLCYVKGSWDLGLRFLLKGSDPVLKSLAQKELAAPTQSADRAALADGWFELGEKDRSPLRKGQLTAHAKSIYESALTDATPLLRAKIEKKLEASAPGALPPGAPVDLLSLIDVKRDLVSGEWVATGKALVCTKASKFARLQLPFEAPDEYDLTVVAERKEGRHVLYVGLVMGPSQFYLGIDDWEGTLTGLGWIDGKTTKDNETALRGKILANDRPSMITCSIRKDGVSVTIDGRKVIAFKGGPERFSNADVLTMPNRRALWIGCTDCRFIISKLNLVTVAGQGRVIR
jgi:hypothetical protein